MRLHLRLAKGPEARFVSHLDLSRALERAVRRAGLPLAYSEGFNPHPKIALCSALAVGATSEGELAEMELREPVPPEAVRERLNAQLPAGIAALAAREAPPGARALARGLRWAAYRLGVGGAADAWRVAVERFLREADPGLRARVAALEVAGGGGERAGLRAVLRLTPEATLRPDDLVRALGAFLPGGGEPRLESVHRLELLGEGEGGPVPLWEACGHAGGN